MANEFLETIVVTKAELSNIYQGYIACLNGQDWHELEKFVHDDVRHNGKQIGLSGHRQMLERNFEKIPDLSFHI